MKSFIFLALGLVGCLSQAAVFCHGTAHVGERSALISVHATVVGNALVDVTLLQTSASDYVIRPFETIEGTRVASAEAQPTGERFYFDKGQMLADYFLVAEDQDLQNLKRAQYIFESEQSHRQIVTDLNCRPE